MAMITAKLTKSFPGKRRYFKPALLAKRVWF